MNVGYFKKRNLLNYDREILRVEGTLARLGEILEGGGYPGQKNLLSVLFVSDFLREKQLEPLKSIKDSYTRELLGDVALSRLDDTLLSRVEELRKEILGASVLLEEGNRVPLRLTLTDFQNEGGVLKVGENVRERFTEEITTTLNDEEQGVFESLREIILSLRDIKSRGWGVTPIIRRFVGDFEFVQGEDLEELPEAVRIYQRRK